MSSISTLGNGTGFIYIVKPDGTSILNNVTNDIEGERLIKKKATEAVSVALNQAGQGTSTIGAPSGVGNVTAVTINGINQINANIAYTGATTAIALAVLIETGINSFTPASGPNYTAIAIGAIVYIIAPASAGSSVNGEAITVSNSGNLSTVETAVEGGSDASQIFDEESGFRFFLNSTGTEGDLTNATEITDFLIPRGGQSASDQQASTLVSGVLTLPRNSAVTTVTAETEGAAATDDMTDITPTGWAEYDFLYFHGTDVGRVITVKTTGNIVLSGSNDFDSGGLEKTLVLQHIAGKFYEVARSSQQIGAIADYRAAGFPFPSQGLDVIAVPSVGGTETLTVITNKQFIGFQGTETLSGNYDIVLDTTGAIAGDKYFISWDAAITVGAFAVTFNGTTLTATQALNGSILITAFYTGSVWTHNILADFADSAKDYKIESRNLNNGAVTVEKLESSLQSEVFHMSLSFESGELGDYRIKMPYPGTVIEMFSQNTLLIEATDDACIQGKNNAGTSMTGGKITRPGGSAFGTSLQTATPTANNTFIAGDILRFETDKPTAGGKATLSVKVQRA